MFESAKLYNKIGNLTKCATNDVRHLDLAGLAECAGQPGGGGWLKPSILDLKGA